MSKLERRTGNKIWRSRRLYLRGIRNKKKLSTGFSNSQYSKKTEIKYYKDYLKTPHWKGISKSYKERFPLCEYCRKNQSQHVHHRNYQNLGHERYWDLIAVCKECHDKKHAKT